jgi:hypothetical protein
MPNSTEVLREINEEAECCEKRGENRSMAFDHIRKKYLRKLSEKRERNVIAYYSAWLQKEAVGTSLSINDNDAYSLMSAIYGLDIKKGLDLILHTPGGDVAAAESIGNYLRKKFDNNITVIVPHLAMSAGTMIACASKEIIMGNHSSLGPIDPHFAGISAHGIMNEFNRAKKEVRDDPRYANVWSPILAKYPPAFIGECENAMRWAEEITTKWLESGMFKEDKDAKNLASKIVKNLSDHDKNRSHARHIDLDKCLELGLKAKKLEDCQETQDIALSIHHAYIHSFAAFPNALKIIENHIGHASVVFSK